MGAAGRLAGHGRVARLLAHRPLPIVGDYVRMLRSLVLRLRVGDAGPTPLPTARRPRPRERPEGEPGAPLTCDVLVVGSGAGGAPTAALLAEAGLDVLVVEEGEHVRQGEVVPFSLEQMRRQYRNAGVTAALGRPSIAYTEGCCVGGGTEINSGLYRRPPPEVLDRWRDRYVIDDFTDDAMYAICDEVERGAQRADPARRPDPRQRRACRAARRASAGPTTRSRGG